MQCQSPQATAASGEVFLETKSLLQYASVFFSMERSLSHDSHGVNFPYNLLHSTLNNMFFNHRHSKTFGDLMFLWGHQALGDNGDNLIFVSPEVRQVCLEKDVTFNFWQTFIMWCILLLYLFVLISVECSLFLLFQGEMTVLVAKTMFFSYYYFLETNTQESVNANAKKFHLRCHMFHTFSC